MAPELIYAPFEERDIEELAEALHSETVYRYLGGIPSRADFDQWLQRSLAGPPSGSTGERWLNFTVRLAETREVVARLEANIHHQLAEVAFLYNPRRWGLGYASHGLLWLHDQLREYQEVRSFWATTHRENQRSASLLLRHGYLPVSTQDRPVLYSYDDGDHVFARSVA